MAAAPAGASAGQSGDVTIGFQAAGTTRDANAASMIGTFAMSGRFADSGTVRTSYRFATPYVGGTATVMGARGIFTISMRGRLGPVVDGGQSVGGRWRLCGGTGVYRHAHGSGLWEAVADLRGAPAGTGAPEMSGTFYGLLARGRTARPPGTLGVTCSPGVM